MIGRILRGGASNVGAKVLSLLTWFLLTPYILQSVGPTGYGLWVMVGSLAAYGFMLDLGIGGAVVKYLAEYTTIRDANRANRLLSTALQLYFAIGTLVFLASLIVAPLFPHLFGISGSDANVARVVVLLMGLNVGLTLAFTPVTNALYGLQRYDLHNLVNVAGTLVTAAATVGVLAAGWGVIGMVGVSIPILILMRLAGIRMVSHVAPELRFSWRGADRQLLPKIFAFSMSTFGVHVSVVLNTKTDEFVIAAFRTVAAVAPYALARKLGELAQLVTEQFLKTFMPLASELEARRSRDHLLRLYLIGTRVALAFFVPLALPLLLFGGGVLAAWVGPQYAEHGEIVAVLALAAFVWTSQAPSYAIMEGLGRHARIARLLLLAAVANVALSIALIGPFGLLGVASATLLAHSVVMLFGVLPYVMGVMDVRLATLAREAWLPALLPAAPAAAVLVGVNRLLAAETLLGFALLAAIGFLAYLAVYLAIPGTSAERALLREGWAKVRRRQGGVLRRQGVS